MATVLARPSHTTEVDPLPLRTRTMEKEKAGEGEDETKQNKKKQGKTSLHHLSDELKSLVIEQIARPSDLKRACLVSKHFHKIAVRFLYRNVALELGSDHDNRLSAFLNPRNIGLPHIRQLRLYLAEVSDKCNQERQAQFAARMLLEFLPEDTLEEFSWCPWRPFSAENLLLLYRKQRRMKWLEVMDLDRDILPELQTNATLQAAMFQHTKNLALYPENRETLNLSGFFVEKCKHQLEEIIVHCNFNDLSPNIPDGRELNDSAIEPGLLTRTIFATMMPFEKCTPFQHLRSLRLHRINLRYCMDSWCKIINFHDLEYLRLYHCPGADTLLGQLCKSSNLPKCLKVLELQHRDNSENEALIALDGFLCLVSGLRDLVIDLENVKQMPAAAGIVRHGKTLELLNVHCAQEGHSPSLTSSDCDSDELVWDTEDFDKICKQCHHLEQLSCAWPSTSLIRSPTDDWRIFETSCTNLTKLITLHITTWPTNKPSSNLLPRAIYEALLQSLAQRIFEIASGTRSPPRPPFSPHHIHHHHPPPPPPSPSPSPPSSKLRLLAFGTSDRIYEREDSPNQIIFLRSVALDADGHARPFATPVSWCVRQFLEPRSDVLDFVLVRSHDRDYHPPVSDYRDGVGGGGGRVRAGGGGGGGGVWGDEDE